MKYEIIVPETPWIRDKPKILFSMLIDSWISLYEAKKLIETTSFDLKKDNWVFVQRIEEGEGAHGQKSQYIIEEKQNE